MWCNSTLSLVDIFSNSRERPFSELSLFTIQSVSKLNPKSPPIHHPNSSSARISPYSMGYPTVSHILYQGIPWHMATILYPMATPGAGCPLPPLQLRLRRLLHRPLGQIQYLRAAPFLVSVGLSPNWVFGGRNMVEMLDAFIDHLT